MAKKTCPKCGKQIETDALYCNDCGSPLESVANSTTTDDLNKMGEAQTKAKDDAKSNKSAFNGWAIMAIIGIVFFIMGCSMKLPSTKLSYYDYGDNYKIEQYVGGDAYNYIIGASVMSGELTAKTIEKTIYIVSGAFMFILGVTLYIETIRKGKREKDE